MRKAHKHFIRPKKPWEKTRLEEEHNLIKKYGLRNKRELWRAEYTIKRIRSQAKKLIMNPEKQDIFLARLARLVLIEPKASLDDVLALTKEDLLERRLQTLVARKFASTPKQARQLITHRRIMIGGKIVTVPGYIVRKNEEASLTKV